MTDLTALGDTGVPLTDIERYALKIVADYAESGVEDDIDEDGTLGEPDSDGDRNPKHEQACDLAHAIIRGIRANPGAMLAMTRN